MEKKFIDDLSEDERLKIGKLIRNMSNDYNELRTMFFVYNDENEAVDEKIKASSELMDSFMAWIKGDNFDTIGDNIFQDCGSIVKQIFKNIGVAEDDNDLGRFT